MNPAKRVSAFCIQLLSVSFLLLLLSVTSSAMILCHCEGNLDDIFPDARSVESAHPSLRSAARQSFECTPGLGKFIECEGVCLMCSVSIEGIKGAKVAQGCSPAYEDDSPPPAAPTDPVNRREEQGTKSEPNGNYTTNSEVVQPPSSSSEDFLGLLWDYASQKTQNQNAREVPDFLFEMYMCNKEKCNSKIGRRTQSGPGQRPDECQNGANDRWCLSTRAFWPLFLVLHCSFIL